MYTVYCDAFSGVTFTKTKKTHSFTYYTANFTSFLNELPLTAASI
jgi:hypothetical protein